ncbi:hypothetical protein HK100_008803 [Physocladia obscura]|uniref:Uncharacterized protein n=1 Tax=Physocladia obscura TaxID=109957 RepID=A0AAD5T6A8_9FUNG|nr:hypothetical protein HK100_008803 [Physocladia obscura]
MKHPITYSTKHRLAHKQRQTAPLEARARSHSEPSTAAVVEPSVVEAMTHTETAHEMRRRSLPVDSGLLTHNLLSASKEMREFSSSPPIRTSVKNARIIIDSDSDESIVPNTQESLIIIAAVPNTLSVLWDAEISDSEDGEYHHATPELDDDGALLITKFSLRLLIL